MTSGTSIATVPTDEEPLAALPGADAATVAQVAALARSAAADDDRIAGALRIAAGVADALPHPGDGDTATLWASLASIAAIDLGVARTIEPHLDALAILRQAGVDAPAGARWGVYAAEGAGHRLAAVRSGPQWALTGSKPWCSLAGRLDRALVTARVGHERALFAIPLDHGGVTVDRADAWASRGLHDVPSVPIRLERVPGTAVGAPGWYLERPGFAWGGIGVAAIWLGGAAGIARTMLAQSRRREPDQLALAMLGRVDRQLAAGGALLGRAAAIADAHDAAEDPAVVALRLRGTIAAIVDDVVRCADHAMGPAPLALDVEHAQRVDDLRVYVRQHHAERDDAALGRAVLDRDA
ncbi:acyl-CoA dehydrogenase family protein [Agrococcus sp. SGAir0287]|uniref:acyl-CoA dehydrogenase family protein n=1 Tax=Agrococcus sp. SGAir0287 TaxID=2070347 RepID=UPI0010CD0A9D|nr:acyl-CoA dehydrogenase family protein [Agrococcus sp. SGAir0287]QCR18131.1 acyl-CoA dehydrogenase [Agrococcus sp. SGAir0287]